MDEKKKYGIFYVNKLVDGFLKVEFIQEAFNQIIVHREDVEKKRTDDFQEELATCFTNLNAELQEQALAQFLIKTATETNLSQLKLLLETLNNMVNNNILSARLVCEQVLACEKLQYKNQIFWIECFRLIRRIIGGVDYKGVREIMKGCREKAASFPENLSSSVLPQMTALYEVLEYIFDRNSCLLPAYFIITEIQKPDNAEVHWKISNLTANFVEQFTSVAQMLTIIFHSGMVPIVEHSGYAEHLINPWRLDPNTLKFSLKGNLPYDQEITQPQANLLRFVLEQPYSRDMVCSILNLQKTHKQRCPQLEEQLVWLILNAMERSELETPAASSSSDLNQDSATPSLTHCLWLHLSSQLIYFVLFQFATFPNIVTQIYEKLLTRDLRKGRDHLMWVLLQFISGSIQRNPLSNFMPVLKLYDILYPEREPLPVPDYKNSSCTHQIAATCIWIHLQKKANLEHNQISRPIPIALKKHYEFLQHLVNSTNLNINQDYTIALLCNAYSTNQDYFSRPMQALIDTILGNLKPQVNIQNQPTTPLSMTVLDSLTVHSKMSLIHSIVTHMIKHAQMKNNSNAVASNAIVGLSPALVETYSRLLVYTEIESLGIKGFLGQLLPAVFKSTDWDSLYTLLEMFSYRMHHIQPHYRVQLLTHLNSLTQIPQTNQIQLHLCIESTALRLINGLGSTEVQPQLNRLEPKSQASVVSPDNEELNKALVLTIARAMHITETGNYSLSNTELHTGSHMMNVKDHLNAIMQNTPHSWAQQTLQCFPQVLNEFFTSHSQHKENKQMLKKSVEEEYRNWVSMTNESDIIAHFSGNPLFLCLLFKMILDNGGISVYAYKILERIKARSMSAHLRKLCDFLVFEVANSNASVHVNKYVDAINDMIWKYNIITIDRLVLCMALRPQEGSEAQVSFFIIQLFLLKSPEFRNRITELVKNSPEHWKQTQWHEKHMAFHAKFPEKFVPDEMRTQQPHTVYFGNVCLRFLPVLDIVIHRYLEVCVVPAVFKSLEVMLEHLGALYKFHDQPITYLYNTLHYYERKLRDRPSMKKKLVGAIINSIKDLRPPNWALTEPYQKNYIQYQMTENIQNEVLWNPDITYYISLVKRLIDTIDGKNMFPGVDWRFNEFPNQSTHALYVTCVELLGLPAGPTVVANNIIDVMIKGYTLIPQNQIHSWSNAIGLIMSNLPEAYWSVIYDRLEEIIRSPAMVEWPYRNSPFDVFNYKTVRDAMLEKNYVLILAIAHSIFHHFGVGQTAKIIDYVKEKLKPNIRTEYQLLYLHHIVSPFLQRLDQEHPKDVLEITKIYYELLEVVDKNSGTQPLQYMDPVCDLLYHMKYMFVGDVMKSDLEVIIRRLRPALQMRLRFITRLNKEDIEKADQQSLIQQQHQQSQQQPSQQQQPEQYRKLADAIKGDSEIFSSYIRIKRTDK